MAAYTARVAMPDWATAQALAATGAAVSAASNAAYSELTEAKEALQQGLHASCQKADQLERGLVRHSSFQLNASQTETTHQARRDAQRLPAWMSQHTNLLQKFAALAVAQRAVSACHGGSDQTTLLVSPAAAMARLQLCHAAGASLVSEIAALCVLLRQWHKGMAIRDDILDTALTRLRLVVGVLGSSQGPHHVPVRDLYAHRISPAAAHMSPSQCNAALLA